MAGGLNTLDAIESKLDSLLAKVKQLDSLVSRSGKATAGIPGSGNSVMPSSHAAFSTPLPGGLSKLFSFEGTGGIFSGLGGVLRGAGGLAVGAATAMPDVSMVLTREMGYYGAGIATGAVVGRNQLQSQTRLGLGQFTTSAGSDAAVAALLAERGVVPGSRDYLRTVAGVAGAARYLNQPNEVAAISMARTTMGQTSSSLMRSFGIFTANPRTGEKLSEAQVFEQIYQRVTAGQPRASVEDTLESLNRGFLGETVRNLPLDEAGKARFSQYVIEKARGITLDLSDPNSIAAAEARNKQQGYVNPFLEAYRVQSKETENMEAATEVYLRGIKSGTEALVALKDFTRTNLIPTFGELNAYIQTILGDRTGQAVAVAAKGGYDLLGGVTTAALGYGAYKAFKSLKNPGVTAAARTALPAATSTLAKGVPVLGTLLSATTGFNSANQNQGFNFGEFGLALGGGAAAGGIVGGPPGALIGAVTSGLAYTGGRILGSMFAPQGGVDAAFGQAGFSSAAGGYIAPVSGGVVSSQYGVERAGGRIHRGVDIAMPEGTPVYAVASGKVVKSQMSTATNFSYGNYVEIQHSSDYSTLYAHLSERLVSVGQEVSIGQMIGKVGSTGLSSGPHLHLEVRKNGVQINPNFVLAEDLMGQGKDYSAANNGGKKQTGKPPGSGKRSASLLDLAVNPTAGAAMSSVSVSSAGVKGRSFRTSQIVAGSFGVSTRGLSSPAAAALGKDGTGGAENYIPLAGSILSPMNSAASSPAAAAVSSAKHQVTINLQIAKASEEEAKKFAGWLKTYLEEEKLTDRMGAF